jgi:hypothetical protein
VGKPTIRKGNQDSVHKKVSILLNLLGGLIVDILGKAARAYQIKTPGPRSICGTNCLTNSSHIRMSKDPQEPGNKTTHLVHKIFLNVDSLLPVVTVARSLVRGSMFKQLSICLWKN